MTEQTDSIVAGESAHRKTTNWVGKGARRPFSGSITIFSTPCDWRMARSEKRVKGAVNEGSQMTVFEPGNASQRDLSRLTN